MRNKVFHPEHQPFRKHPALRLQGDQVDGALWFLHPTRAIHDVIAITDCGPSTETLENLGLTIVESRGGSLQAASVGHKWTSRNNRKGIHALVVREPLHGQNKFETPMLSTSPKLVLKGIWRMGTCFWIWDISWLTAVAFTVGCAVLLTNALLSFMPYVFPKTKLPDYIIYIEAVLTFIGCALFLVGSFLAFIEAVHSNRQGCFGWKLEHDQTETGMERAVTRIVPDDECLHHHYDRSTFVGHMKALEDTVMKNTPTAFGAHLAKGKGSWTWLPTARELRTYYRYDHGFVTCAIMLCSSILFCSASIASMGTLICNKETARWIRVPQLIAGLGFMLSSALFMIENQRRWWCPAVGVLGWHLSLWNLFGSIGFTLDAIFGLVSEEKWAQYQLGCHFLWGSGAFLIGNMMQWYEAMDKHPVERMSE